MQKIASSTHDVKPANVESHVNGTPTSNANKENRDRQTIAENNGEKTENEAANAGGGGQNNENGQKNQNEEKKNANEEKKTENGQNNENWQKNASEKENKNDPPIAVATNTAVNNEPNNEKSNDPFDPKRLALGQDFGAAVGVRKLLTTVPVRKPLKHEWVFAHPNTSHTLETAALAYKEDREEIYLVERALWPELSGEIRPIVVITTINRQGVLFLWPIKLPGPDGRHDAWNASALEAVSFAKRGWVRVAANMSLGAYELHEPVTPLPPPAFPEYDMHQLLAIAFKDRVIRDLNHVVLKKLRGEV